jgi:DNA-directed RNA polymerase subunit N (RpoN/RPB10)
VAVIIASSSAKDDCPLFDDLGVVRYVCASEVVADRPVISLADTFFSELKDVEM